MAQKRKLSLQANLENDLFKIRKLPDNSNSSITGINDYYQNLYATPPDFKRLARLDPDFAAITKGRDIDFNDPKSVMQLTKTLLKLDFGLDITLPEDRLCPPVPNRHNYVLWLKSLLDTTTYDKPGGKAIGLDIGTGASCIYPLLGCTQHPWSFIATDIDTKSLEYANQNIKLNNLSHRITLLPPRTSSQPLIPLLDSPSSSSSLPPLDFTMTNPPFYSSPSQMLQTASLKSRPPLTACTGSPNEMIYPPGGELAFITQIFRESQTLSTSTSTSGARWYTAMLGFLSTLTPLVEIFKQSGVDNYAVTEFIQGGKTRRWAVGWSFHGMRPGNGVARGLSSGAVARSLLPAATEVEAFKVSLSDVDVGIMADGLRDAVGRLDLVSWAWDQEMLVGVGRAVGVVWNRAWRRKKMREMKIGVVGGHDDLAKDEERRNLFGFRVSVCVGKEDLSVWCRWLEGHDEKAFESFCGYVKTTVEATTLKQTK